MQYTSESFDVPLHTTHGQPNKQLPLAKLSFQIYSDNENIWNHFWRIRMFTDE
jgi:hypothetical protein